MNPSIAAALSTLRERIGRFELAWRRTRLPPPTRARPLPDADAVRVARMLEECGRRIDRIGGRLRNRPAGAADDGALEAHLSFLVELTDRDDGLADVDQMLTSLRHLAMLAETA